jgi:hypothetical protein
MIGIDDAFMQDPEAALTAADDTALEASIRAEGILQNLIKVLGERGAQREAR